MDQTPQQPDTEETSTNSDDEQTPVLPALADSLVNRISLKLSPMAIQWLVGLAAFALIAFQLGTQSLFETSEGRYASVAQAMAQGGSWLKPEMNGVAHFTKPPLTYWASAVGMKLFGNSELGAKAFLPFAAALTAVGCYRVALLLTTLRGALCGTIVLLTSLFFAVQSRGLTADPLLAMFETWMVWALVRYHTRPSPALASGFWALAGAAFLTKGPPGLLPLLGLIPGLALRGGKETLKSLFWHIRGWFIFAVIGLGWYIWMASTVPGLLQYFIFDETIARVASEAHGRTGPVYYFVGILIAGMFPWTAFFVGGLAQGWCEARSKEKPWGLAVFLWFAIPFIVLSLAKSKLAPYALPLLVPASIMTGFYLSRLFVYDEDEPFAYKLESALTIIFFAIMGVTVMTLSIMGFLPDPKISRVAFFISFYFMFLAVFGYSFMNLGILKGIMLVLGVTVPGIMLMLLPAMNGDEEVWKGSSLPGYRRILQKVATLPKGARILFVNDVLESGRFYIGRDIPTWNVKRETRFDPRAEKMVLSGNETLKMLASPDLFLLMKSSSRDDVRYITHYSVDELDRQGKWGLYSCGTPLSDGDIETMPAPASFSEETPVAGEFAPSAKEIPGYGTATSALPDPALVSSSSRPLPGSAHIDAIMSPGGTAKSPDPLATEWAAAMAVKSAQPPSKSANGQEKTPAEKSDSKDETKQTPKAASKAEPKPVSQVASKTAQIPVTKPVKPVEQKKTAKAAAKPAPKPVTKATVKPPAKKEAKSAPKPQAKPASPTAQPQTPVEYTVPAAPAYQQNNLTSTVRSAPPPRR